MPPRGATVEGYRWGRGCGGYWSNFRVTPPNTPTHLRYPCQELDEQRQVENPGQITQREPELSPFVERLAKTGAFEPKGFLPLKRALDNTQVPPQTSDTIDPDIAHTSLPTPVPAHSSCPRGLK